MRVNHTLLRYALLVAPTPTWRAGMNHALYLIESSAASDLSRPEVWMVDDAAWYKAMNILARLPSGGRWVWKARERLFWAIDNATKGEKE